MKSTRKQTDRGGENPRKAPGGALSRGFDKVKTVMSAQAARLRELDRLALRGTNPANPKRFI